MAILKIMPDLENINKGLNVPGIIVYAKSKGLITGASDALEDIVAEARAELSESKSSSARSSR